MKGSKQVGRSANGIRARPGLARSITLAEIGASIRYWRGQAKAALRSRPRTRRATCVRA
jgi:hypothetical protein